MPFATIKVPRPACPRRGRQRPSSRAAAHEADEEVADGGYGRTDEVFIVPDAYLATG